MVNHFLSIGKIRKKTEGMPMDDEVTSEHTDDHVICRGKSQINVETGRCQESTTSRLSNHVALNNNGCTANKTEPKVVLSDISNLIGSGKEEAKQSNGGEEEESPVLYNPVTVEWSVQFCRRFGINIESTNVLTDDESLALLGPAGPPMMIRRVIGDGNCFFRCISRIVTGKQKYYSLFRSLVMEFMRSHVRGFGKIFDVKSHLVDSQMYANRTWATECEIFAVATMLQTTINIFTQHGLQGHEWVPYHACFKLRTLSRSTEQIYLSNYFNCHFNIVEDVYSCIDGKNGDENGEYDGESQ